MVVGLCCSLYFGDLTKSQINLNFDHYRGGAGAGSIPGWAQVVSYFVALFVSVVGTSPPLPAPVCISVLV